MIVAHSGPDDNLEILTGYYLLLNPRDIPRFLLDNPRESDNLCSIDKDKLL